MRKSRYYVSIILTFLVTKVAFSQLNKPKKEKFPSYFGVQVRPVFPTQFIGEPITVLTNDYLTSTITQKTGYSFGGTVRAGLTKLLALETGINFTQRNFDISMAIPDSNLYAKNDISFISYDIPINGLVYIQLSEKFYMTTSLGIALTFKPTNVGVLTLPGGKHSFTHTGYSQRKAGIDLNANFGFEYRTEKSGFFYIGGSARVPFNPVFTMVAQYKNQGNEKTVRGEIDGSFLALDFKYFFPNIKNKGPQFQQGPIQ